MSATFTDLRSDITMLRRFLTQRLYAARLIDFCESEGIIDCCRKAGRFTAAEMNAILVKDAGFKTGDGRERMAGILIDLLEERGALGIEPSNGPTVYTFKGKPDTIKPLDAQEAELMQQVFAAKMEFFETCLDHAGGFMKGEGFLYEFDDSAAGVWDRFLGNFEFKVAREFLLNSMNSYRKPAPRILDLCCGTGHGLEAILKQWPDARLTALDFTGAMRDTALAKAARHNGSINWIDPCAWAGFGHKLPFADASFDKVFFSCGDPYINEPIRRAVYAEIKRVLAPGGILGSVAWGYPDKGRIHVNNPWIRTGVYIHDFAESVCRGWQGFHDVDATIKMAAGLGFERSSVFFNNYYMLDTAIWIFKAPGTDNTDGTAAR